MAKIDFRREIIGNFPESEWYWECIGLDEVSDVQCATKSLEYYPSEQQFKNATQFLIAKFNLIIRILDNQYLLLPFVP